MSATSDWENVLQHREQFIKKLGLSRSMEAVLLALRDSSKIGILIDGGCAKGYSDAKVGCTFSSFIERTLGILFFCKTSQLYKLYLAYIFIYYLN
jgi:hypothetical protein